MVLNREMEYWQSHDAVYTATEIEQQPKTWRKSLEIVETRKDEINAFLDNFFSVEDHEVILTGAGTSEFVGNSLLPFMNTILNYKVKSYATTDIVASPASYLNENRRTLLISYGRSGNSPESVAAVKVANEHCKDIWHIFVTCNKEGELSIYGQDKDNCLVINLPDETCDKAFAMTSSFSSMYVSCAALMMQYKGLSLDKFRVVADKIEAFLAKRAADVEAIVNAFDYGRVDYLGSNVMKGVSQEIALKTCELTAGNVMTTYDSSMGFRHGPKSVVKENSLNVVGLSDDPYTRQYDVDIVKEINGEGKGKLVAISGDDDCDVEANSDYFFSFKNGVKLESLYLGLEYAVVGQLLALYKSIHGGNTPDNPCSTGQVSRVVHGVSIHEYKK